MAANEPPRRLWLVFFGEAEGAWWTRLLKPGFRHVCAAAWYADRRHWVYFDPAMPGTSIRLLTEDEWNGPFATLLASTRIVRFKGRYDRRRPPARWWCVGAIKSLLGIESRAFTPYQLYRDLLRQGGEEASLCVEGASD